MAYKYAKGKIFRGDIYNEDDTQRNTFIDFSDDAVGIIVGNTEGLIVSGSGAVSSSLNVSASGFYGDGSGLSGVTATASPAGLNGQIQFNDQGSTAGAAELYWHETNNRLGIGTNNPSKALDIEDANSAGIQLNATNHRAYTVASDGYGFIVHDNTTGGTGGYRFVISDQPGYLGYVGIGSGVGIAANAHPKALLHLSSSDDQALLRVDTTGGSNATTVLFATGSGRVGIGTSSPDTTLHIEGTGDGSMWEALRITNTGGTLNDDSAIYFTHYTDDRLQAFIKDDVGSGWDTKLHFGTADNSNTAATKMTLDGDGKLGIGTETPASTFEVSGSQAGNYTQTAGNITVNETHYVVDYTGDGNATFTLPASSGVTGRQYHILSHAQGATDKLTITGSGGAFQGVYLGGDANSVTIDGNTPQSITVLSTGTNWFVLHDGRSE